MSQAGVMLGGLQRSASWAFGFVSLDGEAGDGGAAPQGTLGDPGAGA